VIPYTRTGPAAASQPVPFPVNISSYFRRPAKVVKQSSRGNSPKNLTRRRTTASHSTTKHRAAWKGSAWSCSVPGANGSNLAATTRPISWHPNSANPMPVNDWTFPHQFPDSAYPSHCMNNSFTTAQVNGLITPLTQPSSAESCCNEAFTPLDELRMPSLDNACCFPEQADDDRFRPPQHNPTMHYSTNQPHMYRQTCTTDLQIPFAYPSADDVHRGTAPPTPDFFPASKHQVVEEGKEAALPESEDEVLVGMGLYDAPSPPSSTVLQGSQLLLPHRRSAGKGLKLEETFQPSTEQDSDGDDGGDDVEFEGDAGSQHFFSAPAAQTTQSGESGPHPGSTSFADQSFLFTDEPEQDCVLEQTYKYAHHFAAPIWTDVYSGAVCNWI
jgi:hypothetical protein